jgi:hypothetical protein
MVLMYYKVLKDNKVIDVLDHLTFVKYQKKHDIMIACVKSEAQAIVSSDKKHFWHIPGLYAIPVDGYDSVELIEIDKYEYEKLRMLNLKTPEEIIDEYTLSLINGGVL